MNYLGINLNIKSKKEHVPKIERFVRTVEERVRSAQAAMPFKLVSKLMIVNIVACVIFYINAFLPSAPGSGLPDTKFPRQLFLGNVVNYKKVCLLHPG